MMLSPASVLTPLTAAMKTLAAQAMPQSRKRSATMGSARPSFRRRRSFAK